MVRTAVTNRLAVRNFAYSMISLSGASSNIDCGSNAYNFDATDPYSFSWWIYRHKDNTSNRGFFARQQNAGTFTGYLCRSNDTTDNMTFAQINNSAGSRITFNSSGVGGSSFFMTRHFWHHFVITNNGSLGLNAVRLYADGGSFSWSNTSNLLDSGTSIKSSTSTFVMLARDGGGVPMAANIANFHVWNRMITGSEVSNLYWLNQLPGGAIGGYVFSEGSGTTVADNVGSANGTISAQGKWSSNTPFTNRTNISAARTAIGVARTVV